MTLAQDIEALGRDVHCPGCQGPLRAEADERWPAGFSWYCPTPDCTEAGGCWPVLIRLTQLARAEERREAE